jgi:competence protein ComEC
VVSAVVMPAGLIGLALAPFGLDGPCWWLMGVGIDWMIVVTQWVAALPGAVGRMAAFGVGPMIAASCGLLLMGLLRTPLRWSGAVVLALATVWALAVPQPDILISGDAHNAAVRGRDGRLHLMRSAKDAFLLKEWLAADADARDASDASLGDGVSCDDGGCVVELGGGGYVAQPLRNDALEDDCERAVLIVTSRQPPRDCGAVVIDQARLRRQGALALWRKGSAFAVEATRPGGFDRPWSPALGGDTGSDTAVILHPPAPRARDATPSESDLQSDE